MQVIQLAPPTENVSWRNSFDLHLRKQDMAESTRLAYRKDLDAFDRYLLATHGYQMAYRDVVTEGLSAFRKHMFHEQKRKPATINRRLQTLKRFFRWCVESGRLTENPAASLHFIRRAGPRRPKSLSKEQLTTLLSVAGKSEHGLSRRNLALVHLMVQAGLRVGEVANLTIGDLKMTTRSGEVVIRHSKGHKERTVPLNLSARRALRRYFEQRGDDDIPLTESAPVFESKRGTPLAVRSIELVISSLARRAGLTNENVTPHTLRHTFAVQYLAQNPGRLDTLADLLGHDSLDTTAIYTKVSHQEQRETVEALAFNEWEPLDD